jgi:hypothetical protein
MENLKIIRIGFEDSVITRKYSFYNEWRQSEGFEVLEFIA